jgi:hypothetical protein
MLPMPLVDGFDPDRCRVLVRRLVRERVWQVPTLSFWQSIVENPPAQWNGPIDRLFAILLRIVDMMSQEGVPIMTGLDMARGKTIADESNCSSARVCRAPRLCMQRRRHQQRISAWQTRWARSPLEGWRTSSS